MEILRYFAALVFIALVQSASGDENGFVPPALLLKAFQKCAKNNVMPDPQVLAKAKTCLEPTVEKAQAADPNGEKPIQTFCQFLPDVTKCYEPLFEFAERCAPEWVGHMKVFRPMEIVKNLEKGLCAEPRAKRIEEVLVLGDEGLSAAMCFAIHQDVILKDLSQSALGRKLLEDPFQIFQEGTCEILDQLEEALISMLDLCDKPSKAVGFTKRVYDVLAGLIFKCEAHENF